MSKTKKDKFNLSDDRRFVDGAYAQRNTSFEAREEKKMKNIFRSGNLDIDTIMELEEEDFFYENN